MAKDTTKKPEGRVIAGAGDIFKNVHGGRSTYGELIMSALTGMTTADFQKQAINQLKPADKVKYNKALAEGGVVDATLLDAEDQFFLDYIRISAGPSILAPSIAPERLERLVAENNALEPCIAAMVTNISCTGYKVAPRDGNEADLTEEQKSERDQILEFMEEVYPRKSLLRVRKELRRDLHTTGNSYAVFEKTADDSLAFIRRAPAKSMRLVKLDGAVPVTVKVMRRGKEVEITTNRAERRFVQKVGTKHVFYKEYGATRDLHRVTGEWAGIGERLPANVRAHEILHEKDIEDVKSPYGVPRWITQLPSVLGSRMAEEHNLAFFQSGGVPPVIIFISGGLVGDKVASALDQYLSGGSKTKQRGIAVEVPSSGDINAEKPANVKVEKFGSSDDDSTFENYDERCEKRVRRAFRLPGIFLGMADSYNFASAHASYVVAEAQVFGPERIEEDEMYNMTLMRELDEKNDWKFASNALTVQDVNIQLRALEMAKDIKGVSLSELVEQISQIANVKLTIAEGMEEEIVGGEGNEPVAPTPAPANAPTAPAGEVEPPAPPVQAQKRKAQMLAASIARHIRDYDEMGDLEYLKEMVELEDRYNALSKAQQTIVDQHLAPVIYTSAFLNAAAMEDVASAYALSAFADARRKLDMETI